MNTHYPISSMASCIDFDRFKLIPLSLTSICNCHSHHLPSTSAQFHHSSSRNLSLSRSTCSISRIGLFLDGSGLREVSGLPRSIFLKHPRIITAVARAEPGRLFDDESKEEVNKGNRTTAGEIPTSELKQKSSQLEKRVVFGLGIGISVGGVVLAGGWIFTVLLAAAVFVGAREYFELVRSRGIADGMTPPPRYVSRVCSVICALMPVLTLYLGQIDVSVTSAAFVVAMALLMQRRIPRFAQLTSAMFGLFYCGYLPCFWVKLRCGLAVPALNTRLGALWPVILGGPTQWTVGLVATLISISSIIAADTFAFIGGKAFGRTPLTDISPKKTWEGALAGLGGCIATSVVLSKMFCWPTSILSAVAFGFLNFFGSLFGDLTESMIKRDAGVKDSGSLIPGHGNYLCTSYCTFQ
ncbi:Phosphatidate cytidylyltransferase 5, chloroplastic [Datura stramonium]|uniref:phosphatidate cytidylyltransferase n=1 Tax=Datura stramonium TaxID=4076 RepID=A0ABS8V776_DATST|nr:Phosphatidate cytidylyltransferase 5, chloroplastic [Datura stramonium]